MGPWDAESPQSALVQFYRSRGFTDAAVWEEDGELVFSETALQILEGTPNTWLVEPLPLNL